EGSSKENAGDVLPLRLARAQFWASRSKAQAEARTSLADLEKGWDGFPADERPRLLAGLAEAQQQVGNLNDAVRLLRLAMGQPGQATDLRLRARLFEIALQAGDAPAMQAALGEMKEIEEGRGPLTPYAEAVRQIWQARQPGQPKQQCLDQAAKLLDTAATRRPDWTAVLLARAEIDELRGNPEQAITAYRRALDQGVREPRVVRQLVQLLWQRQRYEEAEQELLKAKKWSPLTADMRRLEDLLSLKN